METLLLELVCLGVVFAGFLNVLSRNPKDEKKLLTYALSGFALTKAIVFFGLMIFFLTLYLKNMMTYFFIIKSCTITQVFHFIAILFKKRNIYGSTVFYVKGFISLTLYISYKKNDK